MNDPLPRAETPIPDPLDHRLHGVAVYNPDLLSEEELKAVFIARRDLLDRLVEDLRAERPSHKLIVGVRGMGKSMLLRRLRYAITDDAQLAARWLPLVFPEEQYNVTRLSDFYLNCLDALTDALELQGDRRHVQQLDEFTAQLDVAEPRAAARQARDALGAMSRELQRGFVLLVDNAERILDSLPEDEEWSFRDMLSEDDRFVLVGASTQAVESSYQHGKPFYDFFDVRELRGFSAEETERVLRGLAEATGNGQVIRWIEGDPARLKTLNVLSGGNPRTVVLLFQLLVQGIDGDVRSDLERLLDMCTPLYKARFEELAPQAQQVLDALAMLWEPATAARVAEQARLEVTKVSSQLARLVRQGLVEEVPLPPGKRTGFQVAERFFNIWYLMRASRRVRRRLLWLVQFLKVFYSDAERMAHAREYLQSGSCAPQSSALRHAEYGFVLAQAVSDERCQRALEYRALSVLAERAETRKQLEQLLDLDGADRELKDPAKRFAQMSEARERVMSADIRWPAGIDKERFWLLLGGSLFLPRVTKCELVERICVVDEDEIFSLNGTLEEGFEDLVQVCLGTRKIAECLHRAVADGYLDGPADRQSAVRAADAIGEPELPVIVEYWAAVFGDEPTEEPFRRFLEISPNTPAPWLQLGNLFQNRLSRFEEAEEAYRKAINLDVKLAEPWNDLGNLLQEHLFRYAEAEDAYRKAIELDPKVAGPWYNFGRLLTNHLSRHREAEHAYRKAIEIDPKYAPPWNSLGILLNDRLFRYAEAENAFRRAIELDPKDALPWNGLGNLLQGRLLRYDEAEHAYRKSIEIDPKYASPWNGLGILLHKHLSRYREAEEAYRNAIKLDPTYASSWNSLGALLHDHLSRYAEAEQAYRKAIELDPDFVLPWCNLGRLLKDRFSRYDEAEHAYRKAIEVDPRSSLGWNALAWFLYLHASDRMEEAEEAARTAWKLAPDEPYPAHTYATILVRRGRWFASIEPARRFLETKDSGFIENCWPDVVTFFCEAARSGHAGDAVRLLTECGRAEQWLPLVEALNTVAEGSTDRLARLAPEVRVAAEVLYQRFVGLEI